MLHLDERDIDRVTEAFHHLLKGRIPEPVALPPDHPDNELRQLVGYVNDFIAEYRDFAQFMTLLSRGDLDFDPPKGRLHVLQSFKNIHANLRHLTWKTQQIAQGDFSQKVDFMCDFSEAFNSMASQLREAFDRIEDQNRVLAEANEVIRREKEKSDRLLLNILPGRVADELKETGKTTPELFEDVTVLFSDLVGFTEQSSRLSPGVLIEELNDLFTRFDAIVEDHGCERIKTIGDAYLVVCGMPRPNPDHPRNVVRVAADMLDWLRRRNERASLRWQARIGIHTGPVVGAVVGVKKYIYDVFGDTINTASRMENCSEPMRINVSEATYARLKNDFPFQPRPPLDVKGKGPMRMYFLDAPAPVTPG